MTNNYFPFKKVVLFCCFSLMLAMKPRALHTIRRFRKRLSKKVQKVLSFQMRRLHCFHLCQKLPQKIHITLCRKSPKLCSWIEVLLLFVLFCFVFSSVSGSPRVILNLLCSLMRLQACATTLGHFTFLPFIEEGACTQDQRFCFHYLMKHYAEVLINCHVLCEPLFS